MFLKRGRTHRKPLWLCHQAPFCQQGFATHGWNILEVCNFIAKRKQFKFQFRFKKRKWLNFFFRILEKVIPDGGPSKWDSEFAFAKCGFRNFIVKLWKICWVSMIDFLKTSWKCWRCSLISNLVHENCDA